nr:MAG TPA: hypothetical protein [Bacteriophage sp.]
MLATSICSNLAFNSDNALGSLAGLGEPSVKTEPPLFKNSCIANLFCSVALLSIS